MGNEVMHAPGPGTTANTTMLQVSCMRKAMTITTLILMVVRLTLQKVS